MYVYIIRSIAHPDRYYTGISDDFLRRVEEHNNGDSFYSRKYRPWSLVAVTRFENPDAAIKFEEYLKTGSGRAFAKKHYW